MEPEIQEQEATEIEEQQTSDESESDEISPENDPDESFADWKARTSGSDKDSDKEEKEEVKDSEKKEDKESVEKTYTVKAHGQEYEVGEKDVPQLLAKAIGADVALEQAAGVQKSAREFVASLKQNPISTLMDIGLDSDEFYEHMENALWTRYQYQNSTPEQKKAFDNEKELKTLKQEVSQTKAEKEAIKKQEQDTQNSKEQEHYRTEFNKQIVNEITNLGLDSGDQHIREMYVKYMMPLLQSNPNTQAKDVTEKVKAELKHLSELSRKQKVEEFKKKPVESKKVVKNEPKPKKIKSIYDLLE